VSREPERGESLYSKSEAETEAVGRDLAHDLAPDDVIYLTGDLGVGKTAFARGLAAGLGAVAREVASPTFAILHEYAAAGGAIVMRHLDLYRLADRPEDLDVLGLPDAVAGAPIAIEWPRSAIRAALPPTREVAMTQAPDGTRRIEIRRLPVPESRAAR
jgi:tRNA threonylcarbamoyl adenosine modification protein YjeE